MASSPLLSLLVLVLLVGGVPASAQVLVFDPGTKDSALWPGAHRVTTTDARWSKAEDVTDYDAPGNGDPVWTNALTEDGVMGGAPTAFRFQAPAGRWSLYLVSGIGGKWDRSSAQFWDFDVSVGKEKWRCQIEAPEWNGPYLFPHHTFSARSDGRIEVRLTPRTKWTLSGIIAWQPKDEVAARKLIAQIEEWAPAAERAKWQEDVRPPAGPAPQISAADARRGFSIWHRHWATPIYPWTNPMAEESDPTLRIFASPGEHEPMTFTVRPLRALRQVSVKVNSIGPVPASAIEMRKVRYYRARRNYNDSGLFRIVPDMLERWQGGSIAAGENATFWLTVHVPPGTRPGLYRGHLRFSADGKVADIPVQLRLLDVNLLDDPNHSYGVYYDGFLERAETAPDALSKDHWLRKSELQYADMAAHGTRNVTLSCWTEAADEKGEFKYLEESLQRLETQLKMAGRFGFQGPYVLGMSIEEIYRKYTGESPRNHLAGVKMPPDPFFAEVTALVRAIELERKRRGLPDFLYQPFDEPGPEPEVTAFMTRVFQAVKAAGVRTYTTASPEKPAYQAFKPYVDVWCTQTFIPDHDAVVADMKARGTEYWCYPNGISGENDHTPVAGARMTYGFGFWRSGFVRLIPWTYQYVGGDPGNGLDARMMDFMVRNEPDGTPVPNALWEAFREGYDDMRYIYTLSQLIAQAKTSSSTQAKREAETAQQVLDETWRAIPVLPQYQYTGFWSPERMDVQRWLIAERAERLTRLLRISSLAFSFPGEVSKPTEEQPPSARRLIGLLRLWSPPHLSPHFGPVLRECRVGADQSCSAAFFSCRGRHTSLEDDRTWPSRHEDGSAADCARPGRTFSPFATRGPRQAAAACRG